MHLQLVTTENSNKITEVAKVMEFKPEMGMFADYIKEREGVNLLETEHGFAIYVITGKEIYLRDIFVKKEFRKQGIASQIADKVAEIGKKAGCNIMSGSVVPSMVGSTASLKTLLAYGMRVHQATTNYIVFIKDLA